MIDFNLIRISLQEWMVRSSGYLDSKVVFEDQTAPRPAKPYITIKTSSVVDIGQEDARGPVDDNGNSEFTGNREFTLSIKSYGDDALNILSLIRDSLNDPTELQTLRDNGVVFVDQLLFTDVNELLETIWEERGQLDLLMRTTSTSTHQLGIIERVYVNGKYIGPDGSVLIDNDLVVTDPDAIAGEIIEVSPAFIPLISPGPELNGEQINVSNALIALIAGSPIIMVGPLSYFDTVLADNPLSYTRHGESSGTTVDNEVFGIVGVYINTPTLGVAGAIVGDADTAVNLNRAASEYASLSIATSLWSFMQNTAIFTIEVWAKLDVVASGSYVYTGNTAGSKNDKGFAFWYDGTNKRPKFALTNGSGSTQALELIAGSNTIIDTDYHHLVVTANGADGFMYIDGVLVRTQSIGTLSTGDSTHGNVFIGAGNNGVPVSHLGGDADETAFYNIYFNAAKVLEHYNAGLGI